MYSQCGSIENGNAEMSFKRDCCWSEWWWWDELLLVILQGSFLCFFFFFFPLLRKPIADCVLNFFHCFVSSTTRSSPSLLYSSTTTTTTTTILYTWVYTSFSCQARIGTVIHGWDWPESTDSKQIGRSFQFSSCNLLFFPFLLPFVWRLSHTVHSTNSLISSIAARTTPYN